MPPTIGDDLAQQIVTFMLGGGALAVVTAVARFVWKWKTGRIASDREKNTSLVNERVAAIEERRAAERERDAADRKRRLALDEVNRLRGILLRNGLDPGAELDFEKTQTPAQLRTLRQNKKGNKP